MHPQLITQERRPLFVPDKRLVSAHGLRLPPGAARRIVTPSLRSRHSLRRFSSGEPRFALDFPQNDGVSPATAMTAIIFANPQSNGLPLDVSTGGGIAMVRRFKIGAQNAEAGGTKYMAQWWWSNMEGFITSGDTFAWNNGSQGYYLGVHPYPYQGNTVSAWAHEIAVNGQDAFLKDSDSSNYVITTDTWLTQGMRVVRNSDTTLTITYYPELPNTDSAHRITWTSPAGYATGTLPPNPGVTLGDSPWCDEYQHETGSGAQGEIKTFAHASAIIGVTDFASEATDFTRMVTAAGAAQNWWSKKGFRGVDDLTDDYGSGISFSWFNASFKAGLVALT